MCIVEVCTCFNASHWLTPMRFIWDKGAIDYLSVDPPAPTFTTDGLWPKTIYSYGTSLFISSPSSSASSIPK